MGCLQLCGGQISGIEAAVHSTRSAFESDDVEAVLLADASNAFNCINRLIALLNIQRLCPTIATFLINSYRSNIELFFMDGEVIRSMEGTTQGDPLAMAMYGLAIVPLIKKLDGTCRQIWYADDSAAWGSLDQLQSWWSQLSRIGPGFGYFANPSKTWLVVKESKLEEATATFAFAGSGVNITCSGRPYLGAATGSDLFVKEYVEAKVASWVALTRQLSEIAKSQPQAAFLAFTHGLQSKWTYVSRVIPNISYLLEPLDTAIRRPLNSHAFCVSHTHSII